MTRYRFPKRARILKRTDFDRVFAARASAADGLIVLYGAASDLDHPRLGLAVSRRVGSAVVRNRWKRVLREVFRLAQQQLPTLDFVCVPKTGAAPDFARLAVSFPDLAQRVQEKLQRGRSPRRSNDAKRNVR